ncbi:hypothetical protein [Saccharopolyspora dendranthemae]|uniref:Uncharacterized protein n=1 Tax=Saccharopolyspora dendranthemae TaxID=1181886 RepID=A0A561V836_9PSEU|nr:hypothetical protein [Saccharopolyspora dendranthemae]TWG07760.1 hypothetical protein FHU35_11379 [Saccharopolyspora dendranthemae]
MPQTTTPPTTGRLRAAWTLVLLTTLCAELTFTAVAVPFVWFLLPLLLVMYGAGVLLVRELFTRSRGGGWLSLVLLALAYQLAEDGIGLQALTSPRIYGAAEWGWRALGINWTYWESQIGVHVVLSVLIPVMLTNLLFPAHRGRPYLRTGGLIGAGALAALGVLGLRVVISATEDPGYLAPWGWTTVFVVAMAVLIVVAMRLPASREVAPRMSSAPKPAVVGVVPGCATIVFLALLLPPGLGPNSLLGGVVPLPVLLIAAALVGIASGWSVLRWSGAGDWTDRHRVWLAGGILVGHTAFMIPASPTAAITGIIIIALEVALLIALARRVDTRHATS